jgi:hypothetical protein
MERASDLKMLISFPFFCLFVIFDERNVKYYGQVCLWGSELKKIIYLGFVPSGGH